MRVGVTNEDGTLTYVAWLNLQDIIANYDSKVYMKK